VPFSNPNIQDLSDNLKQYIHNNAHSPWDAIDLGSAARALIARSPPSSSTEKERKKKGSIVQRENATALIIFPHRTRIQLLGVLEPKLFVAKPAPASCGSENDPIPSPW
jgi:hypothetical protein